MNDIVIIALKYLEPEYQKTIDCINATGLPVVWADREGVGNMSKAFNRAVEKWSYSPGQHLYFWFITNILFEKDMPQRLATFLDMHPDYAAIHPACNSSDHPFLHQYQRYQLQFEIPFVELMAPMIRITDFIQFCEETPYWYMDLIYSAQLRELGRKMAVDHSQVVQHCYMRNAHFHHITQIRRKLRDYHAGPSKKYMIDTYGNDWEMKLRYKFYK